MKEHEIWIGWYHLGQGSDPPAEPEKVGSETASTFELACLKYELRSKLRFIEDQERQGRTVHSSDFQWWYNPVNNTNSWTGKYYPSREEALKSFSKRG